MRSWRRITGTSLLVGALSGLLYAGPAAATASPAAGPPAARAARAVLAHTPRASQPPISEVCDDKGAQSLCANRNGGREDLGTYVIAWSAGDPNNDFGFTFLSGMCNHGYVSVQPACPFSPRGDLNDRYRGAPIAAIFTFNGGGGVLCVADSGTGSGVTVTGACPDPNGNGGADGTIFVLPQITDPLNPNWPTYVVSRYWSDDVLGGNGTSPRWLCVIGKDTMLTENGPSGNGGTCQWNEIHN